MEEITKVFPGVIANDSVSFDLRPGEVHALVGENGAGKTTLMKILYGLHQPDSGRIFVKDSEVRIQNPRDAIRKGIGMVHQHFMLVPPFTVTENIILGEERSSLQCTGLLSRVLNRLFLDTRPSERRIRELIEHNGLAVEPDRPVEELSVGLQQRVEILKILYRGAEVLVFDEPTAVLTPQEVDDLFDTFRELTSQGKGVVFISHKLDEVLTVADRVTVIRRGKIIETMDRSDATKARIAESMVGKPVLFKLDRPEASVGLPVLALNRVSVRDEKGVVALSEIELTVRAGEVHGIAGVEGNGQAELVRVIAQPDPNATGTVLLKGQDISDLDVRSRRERGIAHIPEDRQRFGLLLPFSIADNLMLGRHHQPPFVNRVGGIRRSAVEANAESAIRNYDIRTPSAETPAHALSGGNQQKVIIAREMGGDPDVLLAVQPTRGVDVGSTEFIYREILAAKAAGKAVLLVSADLDEVLALSDRISVLYRGKITRELEASEATKEKVGYYMLGGSPT
jgi:simple sugar transport system ATP-binding protein